MSMPSCSAGSSLPPGQLEPPNRAPAELVSAGQRRVHYSPAQTPYFVLAEPPSADAVRSLSRPCNGRAFASSFSHTSRVPRANSLCPCLSPDEKYPQSKFEGGTHRPGRPKLLGGPRKTARSDRFGLPSNFRPNGHGAFVASIALSL